MSGAPLLLVTGGAGFIGSHLVDALLARGDRVRVLDDLSSGTLAHLSPRAEFLRGSVADPAAVRDAMRGVDGVFHLAAVASVARCAEEWGATHAINQSGTVHVLEAARLHRCVPVVYASSAAVYGARPDGAPGMASEHDAVSPCSPYGCDKRGSELHAIMARGLFGVPSTGLRFFNVYGPRQNGASPYSGVISIFRDRLLRGEPLVLNGGGVQTRDFVHVHDVVRALLAALAALPDAPAVLNVCTGRTVTVREVATRLAALAGVEPCLETAPAKPGDILHSCGDPGSLRSALGIECRIGIEEGLADLLDHGTTRERKVRVA